MPNAPQTSGCQRQRILWALSLVAVFAGAAAADASSPRRHLTVHMRSGRTFTAPVDARTNNSKLWLRFEGRSVQLFRPIEWSAIVGAEFEGETVELNELKGLARSIASQTDFVEHLTTQAPEATPQSRVARRLLFANAIQSIEVGARKGNWDADAADDGLLLYVDPMDRQGRPTAAAMRLEVTLETTDTPHVASSFRRAHHWATSLSSDEVRSGQPAKLEFPPNSRKWGAYGRLTVRAVAPGYGVFQRQTSLPIKP